MFDMSWGEVLVIGAVALIVIGPKDLPKALRTLGNMTSKLRRMAGEFQSQFNEAMREAELDEIKKQVQGLNDSVGSFNPIETARDELKSSIESTTSLTPAAPASPVETAAETAQLPGEAGSPLSIEPPPVAPPPPVDEPAASVAAAVEQGVSAEPEPSFQRMREEAAESSKA